MKPNADRQKISLLAVLHDNNTEDEEDNSVEQKVQTHFVEKVCGDKLTVDPFDWWRENIQRFLSLAKVA